MEQLAMAAPRCRAMPTILRFCSPAEEAPDDAILKPMSEMTTASSTHRATAPADDVIVLRGVGWADYQRLLEIRDEQSTPRFTYLEGVLELMTPSQPHESIKSMIGRLIEAWCLEQGVGITPYGSWTHESKEAERGIEPDECYVVGDRAPAQRADLAIEVEWSRSAIDKLDVYRRLGVQEVWIWRKNQIEVFGLRGEQYVSMRGSELLAGIDLPRLLQFIDVRPMTRAVTEYRDALRRDR
jgi:Uma2 family endonuclease